MRNVDIVLLLLHRVVIHHRRKVAYLGRPTYNYIRRGTTATAQIPIRQRVEDSKRKCHEGRFVTKRNRTELGKGMHPPAKVRQPGSPSNVILPQGGRFYPSHSHAISIAPAELNWLSQQQQATSTALTLESQQERAKEKCVPCQRSSDESAKIRKLSTKFVRFWIYCGCYMRRGTQKKYCFGRAINSGVE